MDFIKLKISILSIGHYVFLISANLMIFANRKLQAEQNGKFLFTLWANHVQKKNMRKFSTVYCEN